MTDLLARLEVAEAGSRELDGAVWCARNGYVFVMWDGAGCVYRKQPGYGISHISQSDVAPVTTSLDAALALAERVLDHMTALGLLHAVIDMVGGNGWPSSRIAPLFCAAILKAKGAEQ